MTDLEIMQRAKMYMDQLAQGIDPISGKEVPEDSTLNNIRLARCFFYVSGILQQVIDNGGQVKRSTAPSFSLNAQQASAIRPSEFPVQISEFMEMLKTATGNPDCKRPRSTIVTDWLLEKGLMQKGLNAEGKSIRIPSPAGNQLGIYTQEKQGPSGFYTAVLYHPAAQQFLLDHLGEMIQLT